MAKREDRREKKDERRNKNEEQRKRKQETNKKKKKKRSDSTKSIACMHGLISTSGTRHFLLATALCAVDALGSFCELTYDSFTVHQ